MISGMDIVNLTMMNEYAILENVEVKWMSCPVSFLSVSHRASYFEASMTEFAKTAYQDLKFFLSELHFVLVRFRVISVIVIAFFLWQTHDLIQFMKENHKELTAEGFAGFGAILTLLGTSLKMAYTNIVSVHKGHEKPKDSEE